MKYTLLALFLVLMVQSTFAMKKSKTYQELPTDRTPLLQYNSTKPSDISLDLAPSELPNTCVENQWPCQEMKSFTWPAGIKKDKIRSLQDSFIKAQTTLLAVAKPFNRTGLLDALQNVSEITLEQIQSTLRSISGKVEIYVKDSEDKKIKAKLDKTIFTSFSVSAISLQADGTHIAIAGTRTIPETNETTHSLLIYKLLLGKAYTKVLSRELGNKIQLLSFSPSGKKLMVGLEEYDKENRLEVTARILSLETNQITDELANFEDYAMRTYTEFGWIDEDHFAARVHKNKACTWTAPSYVDPSKELQTSSRLPQGSKTGGMIGTLFQNHLGFQHQLLSHGGDVRANGKLSETTVN